MLNLEFQNFRPIFQFLSFFIEHRNIKLSIAQLNKLIKINDMKNIAIYDIQYIINIINNYDMCKTKTNCKN